jgi:hypothetical protein
MSQDTPVTPYTRLPVFTDSAIRDRLWDCRNLQQSTAIYSNLLYSAMFRHILPTCFYRNICDIRNNYDPKPILLYTRVNWVTKSIIYTLSSCFLISFPYVMFWLYHTVHIYSLIISTSLYIIATYTHFIILYCVNHLYYCIKCRMNPKPL